LEIDRRLEKSNPFRPVTTEIIDRYDYDGS